MKRKRTIIAMACTLLCLLALLAVNRDLFHYRFVYPYAREFTEDGSTKGFASIYDGVALKPAVYQVLYEGDSQGKENAICIQDSDGNVLAEQLLPEGSFRESIELKIEGSARSLRLGILYAGEGARLRVDQITLESSHVLYRDSLLRHLTISAALLLLCALLILRFCFFPKFLEKMVPSFLRGENERVLLFLLLMTLFSCYPLMIPDSYLLANDTQFHLGRIEGIAEAIRAGEFPARIHLFLMQGYGYGSGFFYPQLWLCIPVLLRLLGFSLVSAYAVFMVLCSYLSTVFTYACAKHISGKNSAGIIAGLLSCFAAYRLIDGFFRGALGEIQTFVFLPLIVWAVYDIFCLKKDSWLLLAAGFMGILGSHLISLALTGVLFLLFLLGSLCCGKLKQRELLSVIKAGVLTLLLGAFFLLPFIEQSRHANLTVNILVSSKSGHVTPGNVLPWRWLFKIFDSWQALPWPGLPLLALPLLLIPSFFHVSGRKNAVKAAGILGLLSLFALWAATDLFPWTWFPWLFNRIQFSWRFLLIPTACLPIAGGILIPEVFHTLSDKMLVIAVLAVSLLFAEPILNETVQKHIVETPQFILQNDRVGGGEYLPRNLRIEYADKNRDTVKYAGEALDIHHQNRRGLSFTFGFTLDALQENAVMEIPLAFYYGYQAEIRLEDGTVLPLVVEEGPNGLTSIRDLPASSGTVLVYYQKTTVQRASEVISLLTLVVLSAWLILQRRRKQPQAPCRA